MYPPFSEVADWKWGGAWTVVNMLGSASMVMEYARVANVDTCHAAYTEFLVAICVSRCDSVAGYLVLVGDGSQVLNAACRLNGFLSEIGMLSLGYYTCHITINGWVVCGVRKILPTGSDAVIVGLSFVLCLFLTFCIVEGLKKNKITAKVLLGKL